MSQAPLPIWWPRFALSVALLLTGLFAYLQAGHAADEQATAALHVPRSEPTQGYASSKECRACHAEQYGSWYSSYHRTMTQPATPETVRGDFSNVTLTYGSEQLTLNQHGAEFTLDVLTAAHEQPAPRRPAVSTLPDGQYPVKLVTGSHHMQVYWFETGEGRSLGQLPFAYLNQDARWVPRQMVFLRPPQLYRPGENGRWNSSCLHCHSTRGEPRLAQDGKHDTRVAELGIACEACHGPGREHIAQLASPVSRYATHLSDVAKDTLGIVNPAKLDAARASVVCSQCHAVWQPNRELAKAYNDTGWAYRPGADPDKSMWLFEPSRQADDARVRAAMSQDHEYAPGQFWRDGQARVSGREYNGMIESKCMQSGELSCMSCHTMHRETGDKRSSAEWADDQLARGKGNEHGDAACTGCHQDIAHKGTAHTQHAAGSSGSSCYNCHMPHTSWGLLKAMRTHRIGSPSVRETVDTGRPNACTLCHLDKSLRWTQQMLETRFGVQPLPAAALAAPEYSLAAGVSLALLGDAGQRALLAAAMRRPEVQRTAGSAWMPAVLGVLMDDPYDAVRYVAGHALTSLPDFASYKYDFVQRPDARPELAEDIAQLGAPALLQAQRAGKLSSDLPFTGGGVLAPDQTRPLLRRRDTRPVHLLE